MLNVEPTTHNLSAVSLCYIISKYFFSVFLNTVGFLNIKAEKCLLTSNLYNNATTKDDIHRMKMQLKRFNMKFTIPHHSVCVPLEKQNNATVTLQ